MQKKYLRYILQLHYLPKRVAMERSSGRELRKLGLEVFLPQTRAEPMLNGSAALMPEFV